MRMPRSISLLPFFLGGLLADAQTMFIPDTSFRAWLNGAIPGIVDTGGNCDTLTWNADPPNSLVLDFTDLNDNDTLDLEGIQHLKVPTLVFYDDPGSNITVQWPGYPRLNTSLRMTSVPVGLFVGDLLPLPDELLSFYCERCGMTAIPDCQATNLEMYYQDLGGQVLQVPPSVTRLILSHASLTELPPMPNVTVLGVANNAVTDWSNVPAGLSYLGATNNNLTAIPDLPAGLQDLDVSWNDGLTTVSNLPAGLTQFRATNCALTSIDPLPSGLQELDVHSNPLTALPVLPAGLTSLTAFTTAISELPALPPTLGVLSVGNSDLTWLPTLPLSLQNLNLAGCAQLTCLPWLPPAITQCILNSTGVTCIPNQPPDLNVAGLGIPLVICDITDPCPTLNPGILGTSFIDQDNDGVRDPGEVPLPYATLEVSPGSFYGGTDADGRYAFGLDVGTWSVTGLPALYQTISSTPATATFTAWQQVDSLNDVGYYLEPDIQDLTFDLTCFTAHRPGFDTEYRLTCVNIGTSMMSGTVTFTHDALTTFVSADPAPSSINGNVLTWDLSDMLIGEQRAIDLTLNTAIGTPIGTSISHTGTVDPVATDETPLDNTFTYGTSVVASFDPNDKEVEPTTLSPAEVATGERLSYTVRFQNTGNFPAERVLITDTLSDDLQWSTIRVIASGHRHAWYMVNGVLHVLFDGIDLPDSTSDEPGSHGFVKFSFVPSSALMLGASVGNTANIYFDFNEPIITNEAVFTVDATASIARIGDDGLRTWPNPVEEVLYIEGAAGKNIDLLDVTGRVVLRERSAGMLHWLDVSALASGGYTVRVAGLGSRAFIKR